MSKKQYKILNKTSHHNETPWGDSPEQIIAVYASVGEEVEVLELIQEIEEKVSNPKPFITDDSLDKLDEVVKQDDPIYNDELLNQTPDKVQYQPCTDQFFTVDGKQLKLSNGVLYNKIWLDVDNQNEYRIISDITGKLIPDETKTIQKLQWNPVESGVVNT